MFVPISQKGDLVSVIPFCPAGLKQGIVFQALPGQQHCYFLNKDAPLPDGRSLQGTLISKIAFQHPGRVPLILNLIRHQVAYNTLIGSCVKRTVLKEGGCHLQRSIKWEWGVFLLKMRPLLLPLFFFPICVGVLRLWFISTVPSVDGSRAFQILLGSCSLKFVLCLTPVSVYPSSTP